MTITTDALSRSAGLAAVAAGLIFVGVQVGHPHLDAGTAATTEVVVRQSLKVLMALLAAVGVTGMYLRQVRETGLLGLVGYLTLCGAYLLIMCVVFVGATVLPSVASTDPAFVDDVLAVATGGRATGDIGLIGAVVQVQGAAFLAGGVLFGLALYRARVLARWAAALLAVSGVVTVALSQMPDALYRLLALPNGIALIALGASLWWARPAGADAGPAELGGATQSLTTSAP